MKVLMAMFLSAMLFSMQVLSDKPGGVVEEPIEIIDVENPAKQPFHYNQIYNAVGSPHRQVLFQVPQGKRLVVEYISLNIVSYDPQMGMRAIIEASAAVCPGSPEIRHVLQKPEMVVVSGSILNYLVSHPIKIYAEPGQFFCMHMNRSGGEASVSRSIDVQVTGYLVDIPI
jgi:hypothetical protein